MDVFRRVEIKYLLTKEKYECLLRRLKPKIEKDSYYFSKILNIYYDTEQYDMIRNSIEKPIYKEKIRLRSYGIPTKESTVFLEIKKKYQGVVGKRRIALPLKEAYNYINTGKMIKENQIMKEIDYCFRKYSLIPVLFLAYDRYSYKGKEDPNLRITFDFSIRFREKDLFLEKGDDGITLLKEECIMEIKTLKSMPMWLSSILSSLEIYPTSFSKYGKVYQEERMNR